MFHSTCQNYLSVSVMYILHNCYNSLKLSDYYYFNTSCTWAQSIFLVLFWYYKHYFLWNTVLYAVLILSLPKFCQFHVLLIISMILCVTIISFFLVFCRWYQCIVLYLYYRKHPCTGCAFWWPPVLLHILDHLGCQVSLIIIIEHY